MAAYRRVDGLKSRADCLYIGISSGPKARTRVLGNFTFYNILTNHWLWFDIFLRLLFVNVFAHLHFLVARTRRSIRLFYTSSAT